MNTTFSRSFLRFLLLLALCACCSCQAVKSSSSSVAPPKATTESERLGDSLMETGRIEQAVAEYDRALADGADKASIAYRKGFAYFNEGQWKKALDLFQDAISLDPEMAIAYEGAGIASFQLGHFNQAADYFIDVMERAPDHWVSYAFMAGVLAAKKNTRGSREMHRKALKVAGKDQFRQVNALLAETYKRGEYLVRTGMYKPGRTEPRQTNATHAPHGETQPQEQAQADETANGNVYRSVQTLSPEKKEKIRQEMLARLNKAKHSAANPESGHEKAAAPELQTQKSNLKITPLDEDEVQALLRAHKTGQIKQRLAEELPDTTNTSDAPETAGTANEDLPSAEPDAAPSATETTQAEPAQAEDTPAETHGPDSFVTNSRQLVTAPVIPSGYDSAASPDNAFMRELPQSGYSAMESSFPESGMAVDRARELQAKGLEPYVAPVHLGDRGTWYRVMFGPYASRKKAKAMRNRLAKQYGLTKAIVIKHTQH